MAKLAIRGHKKRGKEVIGILEILGGSNAWGYIGNNTRVIYYIDETYEKFIACSEAKKDCECITFTLEEFLEKFPYKVGDKVIGKTDKCIGIVTEMCWEGYTSCVKYCVTFGWGVDFGWYSAQSLQPYKEETMETETHRGYYTTEEENTNKSKKVAWFTFWGNDFADRVELDLSDRELIQEDGKWFVVKKKKGVSKNL